MTFQIPACRECKHFRVHRDDMFSTCALYQYENVDYFNGTVTKHNALALAMRDKEQYCGREGKNFEQKQYVEEEIFSFRQYIKQKLFKWD
jgi:hypothetical protein